MINPVNNKEIPIWIADYVLAGYGTGAVMGVLGSDHRDFEFSKKYDSLTSSKDDVMLAKPQTFMNESGKAAATILKNQSNPVLVVVHDDIDLPLGTLKIVKDRGSAGHKGIESIIQSVGNEGLIRFRLGIASNNESAKQVVLKKFNEEEQKILDEVIGKSVEALDFFIKQGLEKTMNKYN